MELSVRWPWALASRFWSVWALVVLALTAEPFQRHLDYFHSPGTVFYRAIVVVLPALAVAAYAYCRVRPRVLRRFELPVLSLVVLIPSFAYETRGALAAALLLAGAAAWGGVVLTLLGFDEGGGGESPWLVLGAGLGALIVLLLLLLGFAGLYRWEAFALLLGAPALLRGRRLAALGHKLRLTGRSWAEDPGTADPIAGLSVFFAGIFLIVVTMMMLAPTVAHDALLMHLPAVRYYASTQALTPLPFQAYSFYPQGVEALMTAAYVLGGQPALQFVHPIFLALTLGAVGLIGRQLGLSRTASFLAATLLLSVPFVLWNGAAVKNDLAVAAFQLMAVYCGLAAVGDAAGSRVRLGAFLLGSSLAIKHTALFGLPWIGLLLLWRLRGRPRIVRELGLLAAIFAAPALGWQARAYALTGNPLYPAEIGRIVGRVAPQVGSGEAWRGVPYVEIPWFVHFNGTRAFESPSENPLGFFLLLSFPVWLLMKRDRRVGAVLALAGVGGGSYLLWGSQFPFLRYAILLVAVILVLACERFCALYGRAGERLRLLLAAMLAYNFLFCLLPAAIISLNVPQALLFAGRIDKTEYLRRALAPYRVMERLQRIAGPEDLTMGIWVTTAGYAPYPVAYHPIHIRNERDAAAARAELAQRTYTILVTASSPAARELVSGLPAGYEAKLDYDEGGFTIYRLSRTD